MSRNGTGTYNLPAGNPVITGTTISSTWANTTLSDIANALTGSIAADGQTPMTGSLDMNTNRIINLLAGNAAGDAVEYAQFIAAFTNPTFTGDLTVTGNGSFGGTGFLLIPKGTSAERPLVPVEGEIRYNTDNNQFEGYANGAWGQLGGGATGGGGDAVFVENSRIVTTSYAMPAGKSAESVGPITINSGATVTIPADERWVVL
jgi:hypothetical protein